MPRQIVLVHGNAFVPQRYGGGAQHPQGPLIQVEDQPFSELMGRPAGKGRLYWGKLPARVWFHAPLTIQIPAEGRVVAEVLMLRFATASHARLVGLRLFDGSQRVAAFEDLSISGDHTGELSDGRSRFVLQRAVPVREGLDLAAEIDFGGGAFGEVRFVSGGVQLDVDQPG